MSGHVTVRLVSQDDVPALTALLAADRDHLAPRDATRPEGYWAEEFQRQDTARSPDLRIAGEWQDHLLLQLLDEPGMR